MITHVKVFLKLATRNDRYVHVARVLQCSQLVAHMWPTYLLDNLSKSRKEENHIRGSTRNIDPTFFTRAVIKQIDVNKEPPDYTGACTYRSVHWSESVFVDKDLLHASSYLFVSGCSRIESSRSNVTWNLMLYKPSQFFSLLLQNYYTNYRYVNFQETLTITFISML